MFLFVLYIETSKIQICHKVYKSILSRLARNNQIMFDRNLINK